MYGKPTDSSFPPSEFKPRRFMEKSLVESIDVADGLSDVLERFIVLFNTMNELHSW